MTRLLTLLILIVSAIHAEAGKPKAGMYRGVLLLREAGKIELPFNFMLEYRHKKARLVIHNADERIVVTDIRFKGDSMHFRMPVFDTEFRVRITAYGLEGIWINHYRTNERILKFTAVHGESRRFLRAGTSTEPLEGRWQATFSPNSPHSSPAVAQVHHIEQTPQLSATFLTETGDYRYLEGVVHNDSIWLSAFDGSHAFLLTAKVRNDSIVGGIFYSGAHWQEPWSARRNPQAALRDPDQITTLADSSGTFDFSFNDTKGKKVSLSDARFVGRPVIVQLMGSWCPNCMDESRYLSGLHKQYNKQGLEVIALAFEKTSDENLIRKRLARLRRELDISYDILVTRAVGKDEASKALPLLSQVSAFPTTIFLNRHHRVVRIHTGFSGPATGAAYEKFSTETESLINKLLQ